MKIADNGFTILATREELIALRAALCHLEALQADPRTPKLLDGYSIPQQHIVEHFCAELVNKMKL